MSCVTLFLWPPHCVLLHRSGFRTLLINKCLRRPEQSVLVSCHLLYDRVAECMGNKIVTACLLKPELNFYQEASINTFLKHFDQVIYFQQLSGGTSDTFFVVICYLYGMIEMMCDINFSQVISSVLLLCCRYDPQTHVAATDIVPSSDHYRPS